MQSLKEVYSGLVQQDQVKVAQVRAAQGLPPQVDLSQVDPDLLKQAQDYDQIGRILARHVFVDLVKEAMDEAGVPEEKKEEELAKVLAMANGEKKPEDEKKEGAGDEKKDEPAPEEEKKAAAKRAILAKMARDPKYVSQLIAKHYAR